MEMDCTISEREVEHMRDMAREVITGRSTIWADGHVTDGNELAREVFAVCRRALDGRRVDG